MRRRHFHRHPDLRFEGCRLPGKLGIRERLGAQPHRQGELRGDGTDEGLHLGCLWELLFKILDLAQQMAIAVLEGAGDFVIATVAIDDQTTWQPGLAEHVLGHAGRPGLPEQEQAEPGVANNQAEPWCPFVRQLVLSAYFTAAWRTGSPSRKSPLWRAAPGSGAFA
jgi:hypothetical protein